MPYFSGDVQIDIHNAIDRLHMASILLDQRNMFFPDDWTFYVRGSDSLDQSFFFLQALAYVFGGKYEHDKERDIYENKYGESIYLAVFEFPLLEEFHTILQLQSDEEKARYQEDFDEYFSELMIESQWNPDDRFEGNTDYRCILFEISTSWYMEFAPLFLSYLTFYEQLEEMVNEMKGTKVKERELCLNI